jgi:4-amino-4-deoxy-L-arabinose transferase-like glycosyltransferase
MLCNPVQPAKRRQNPEKTMSVARHDPTDQARSRLAGCADRLGRTAERFVAETSEGAIVLSVLAAFVVLWMIFWTVSTASLDVHIDNDEALGWAQHFAFGYKHPPMTGWLFILWFSIFPREKWAVDLLNVMNSAVALGITWRLLRDHLDKNRALLGLLALMLIPLYDAKAEVLNANTVMIPFWAATLLFYLRARRGLGVFDAFLAGAFASLTMLGKYWAVFLLVGMVAASLVGPGTKRFWRSPAPYAMAAGAIIAIAPHIWWSLNDAASLQFAQSVINHTSFGETLEKSALYVLGAVAYIVVPLIFLAALRPSRAALADIVWPADDDRQQACVLLLVPLILPALVNLVIPYRLTPDWTFPNWALLPVVLYASPRITVDARAAARAGVVALAMILAVVIASPVIAGVRVAYGSDQYRPHFRQVAELADRLSGKPVQLYWGSGDIIAGLPVYLPGARLLSVGPLSDEGRADSSVHGLVVVCLTTDAGCRTIGDAFAKTGARTATVALTRSFLGFTSPPLDVQITVVPQAETPARATQ